MLKPYYQEDRITIYNGDCRDILPHLPKVDLVLTDPPYGTTQCKWDTVIPFKPMWKQLNRIIKSDGAIVLFGSEPFSSYLRMSNIKEYKYDWIWEKDKATNHLNAKIMPMRKSELISVFYSEQCIYNPQLTKKNLKNIRPATTKRNQAENYGKMTSKSIRTIPEHLSYPNEMLKFRGCFGNKGQSLHPTQKPVALMQYLIKTYTNSGGIVLDFTMGSGTTLVAAKQLGRKAIGIELEKKYCDIAIDRLRQQVFNF